MTASQAARDRLIVISRDVQTALATGLPVVALESAVVTHGLPSPANLETALEMQASVAAAGAVAATIAIVDGVPRVGLSENEIAQLTNASSSMKVGVRDLPAAAAQRLSGGTTVGATMHVARAAGIDVFATGGIGGVHRENRNDVSADLPALANTPLIVVCSGAKSILDLPATLEVLETLSVPVLGFGTNEFPAFYSRESGLATSARVSSASEAAQYWSHHASLGLTSAVLIANPIPVKDAIDATDLARWTEQASAAARDQKIQGKALTPFLLARLAELSGGRSVASNKALLLNNAALAAEIASAIRQKKEPEKWETASH